MGYPVMLNLAGKSCVIVGGGTVAERKAISLIDAGATVIIISPTATPFLKDLHQQKALRWVCREYSLASLQWYVPELVFAATDSQDVNQRITRDAHSIGTWVNNVSDGELSDFHNLAIVEQPPIRIGVSTQGASPALLKQIQTHLHETLSPFATLAEWLGDIRAQTRDALSTQRERQDFYEHIIASDVLRLLQAGDDYAAETLFHALVGEVLS